MERMQASQVLSITCKPTKIENRVAANRFNATENFLKRARTMNNNRKASEQYAPHPHRLGASG